MGKKKKHFPEMSTIKEKVTKAFAALSEVERPGLPGFPYNVST